VNINKLKGKIVENGMNIEEFADRIGMHRTSLYRKLNNAEKITIGEAVRMKSELRMSDADAVEIFLS